MARRTLNRKEMRKAGETAERLEEAAEVEGGKAAPKKKAVKKRASRSKTPKEVRKKAFWGVFNQQLKQVALYEYSDKDAAAQKAEDLSTSQKSPHFVKSVKKEIEV